MNGDSEYLWVLMDFLGTLLVEVGVGVVDKQFWKCSLKEVFYDENLCLFQFSSMKRNKRKVANTKVKIAFFIHLHIVIMRDVKNKRNNTKSRKTYIDYETFKLF